MTRFYPLITIFLLIFACERANENDVSVNFTYKWSKVKSVELVDYVESIATIEPFKAGIVQVYSKVNGILENLNVKVGDSVRKGDVLALVKSSDISDIYAQMNSLRSELDKAEKLLDMKRKLYNIGAISKEELLEAENEYNSIKAQYEGIEEKVKYYQINKNSLYLTSPINGIVYQINVREGEAVSTDKPILSIADPKNIVIVAKIPENEIKDLKLNKKIVEFYINDDTISRYLGNLLYISDVVNPDTRTIDVYIKPINVPNIRINSFFVIKINNQKKRSMLFQRML